MNTLFRWLLWAVVAALVVPSLAVVAWCATGDEGDLPNSLEPEYCP
ncbi:MAG: hypothetical protein KY445_00925 [Armatimonadetes bacterium]|nr:hypothetical protein [Armatimonadota bacterium]